MQHGIFSGLCAIKRLNRRRCRAEQHKRIFLHRTVFRHIPRMIARTVFGFIGVILFFIQNDKPQILRRCEYCRPCADNDAGFSGTDSFPAVIAFSDRQRGVQHGRAAAKLCHEFANQLRRQADFRYKDNRAFSSLQRAVNEPHIHLRLAAARHTEQQCRFRMSGQQQRFHAVIHRLLRLTEHKFFSFRQFRLLGQPERLFFPLSQHTILDHGTDCAVTRAGHIFQVCPAHASFLRQHADNVHANRTVSSFCHCHRVIVRHTQPMHRHGLVVHAPVKRARLLQNVLLQQRVDLLFRQCAAAQLGQILNRNRTLSFGKILQHRIRCRKLLSHRLGC